MVNFKQKIKNRYYIIGISLIFVLFGGSCDAVILSIESGEDIYYKDDIFIVELKIDTEGECINVIEGHISFTKENLEVVDMGLGGSIITVWLEKPNVDTEKGIISFIGGIPGGYCGILLGDLGETNILNKIIFRAKESINEKAEVKFLGTTKMLLNDGVGTEINFSTVKKDIKIISEEAISPKTEWQEEIEKDNIPPEKFNIEIRQDASIFDGKYFIVFSTTDKQTGIDHYEIKEGNGIWKIAESPYLLENQELQSIIRVRAIDKAGNEVVFEYNPTTWFKKYLWFIVILAAVIIFIVYKRIRRKSFTQ